MSQVWVGTGMIIQNQFDEILMLKRKSEHGHGQYSIPGGAIDLGEKIESAAVRELYEETNIIATDLQFLGVTNNLKTFEKEGIQTVSLIFKTSNFKGEAKIMEPTKHELLAWYSLDALPEPLFEACYLAIQMMANESISIIEPS